MDECSRCFQSCRFDSSLVDSGREAWQGGLGLRDQTHPLKKSCVCGEEGGGTCVYVRVKKIQEGREVCVKGCVRGRGMCEG